MLRHFAEPAARFCCSFCLFLALSGWRAACIIHLQLLFNERRTTMTHAEIHLHRSTTLTPEQYIRGLTDFGPGRSKLFGNSADEYLKVHDRGSSQADVTEGSGGIWERLHYDWSDPNRVVLGQAAPTW